MPQLKHISYLLPFVVVGIFSACEMQADKPIIDPVEKPDRPPTGPNPTKPEPQVPGTAKPTPPPAPKLSLATILTADKIYFRSDDVTKQFQFKPKEADAVKFYDADGAEICKLTMHPDKLKVKSADDTPLFELKWHGDKISFKDGATDKELSKLRFHDEYFEFVAGEQTKAKIIHEDGDNYRVEDAAGMKIGTLTAADGHAHFTSADGKKLSCDKTANPLAMAGFALPDLTPAQQAAIFIYFVSRPTK